MPYENEFANYEPLRRIADNQRIHDLLGRYRVHQIPLRKKEQLIVTHINDLPISNYKPDWVLAIDGSFLPVAIKNGFPGSEAAYITIASVMMDMAKVRKLDEYRPVNPKEFRLTQESEAIDDILPGRNFVYEGDESAKVSFRRSLYSLLDTQRMSPDGETLLDTYQALLKHKPPATIRTAQGCPYEDCPVDGTYDPQNSIFKCSCKKAHDWFSSDALRIHERMNPISGSNDRIYSEVMQVLERLWIIHILRTLEQKNWLSSLKRLAIVVDGPLAIFGQPAWISQCISYELKRINQLLREKTGEDILLIGIEKGGEFAEHFAMLDESDEGETDIFPKQTAVLLTDAYIKRNIAFSDSDKPYGMGTYFGRKFLYKTKSGARIVATIPYFEDNHSDWSKAEISSFPRLNDAIHMLDELVSSRYPNSLQPIIAAHSEASIPLNLGKKVLERLARELTQKNRT